MRLTIFGASGRTGQSLVSLALEQGHTVTAFVRRADAVAPRPHLDVVVGDIGSREDVERVVNGQDVVLLTLGVAMGARDQVCTIATAQIVPAMQKFGVRRLVNLSGIGTRRTLPQLSALGRLAVKALQRLDGAAFLDKENQDALIQNSDLDWINVCPPWLTNGPRRGAYRVGCDLRPPVTARISRADVADFMLKQLIDPTYVGRYPMIFY